ncbi:MAG: hypothetical protein ABIR71_06495 [Chthoniobacterales bacterium]
MNLKKLTLLALATAASIALGSATTFATTIVDPAGFVQVSDSGGGTGINVLYNPGQTGTSIQAMTNSGGFTGVFTSTEMISSAGGQASLVAVDGGLRDLCFSLNNGATFTTLILNPDVVNGQTGGFITFQITYIMPAGVFNTATFTLGANGQNFFRIEALNGALLTQVCWTSTVDIADANQYRIDGLAPAQTVPDGGATLMLLGAALATVEVLRRTLLKRSPVA